MFDGGKYDVDLNYSDPSRISHLVFARKWFSLESPIKSQISLQTDLVGDHYPDLSVLLSVLQLNWRNESNTKRHRKVKNKTSTQETVLESFLQKPITLVVFKSFC